MSLQDLIKMTDYELRPYSGRGMYGKECLGVSCEDVFALIADLIECAEYDPEYESLADDVRGIRTDDLGRRTIVYWPDIPYEMQTPTVVIENATPDDVAFIEDVLVQIRATIPIWRFPAMAGPAWNRWKIEKEESGYWSLRQDSWETPIRLESLGGVLQSLQLFYYWDNEDAE